MKIFIFFPIFFFAIALLVFGQVPPEAVEQTGVDQISVEIQAKADAQKDVDAHFTLANSTICSAAGCMATLMPFAAFQDFAYSGVRPEHVTPLSIVSGVSCFLTMITVYSIPINPPVGRLIGKSPKYVDVYTDAYKAEIRTRRMILTAGGAAPFGFMTLVAIVRDR